MPSNLGQDFRGATTPTCDKISQRGWKVQFSLPSQAVEWAALPSIATASTSSPIVDALDSDLKCDLNGSPVTNADGSISLNPRPVLKILDDEQLLPSNLNADKCKVVANPNFKPQLATSRIMNEKMRNGAGNTPRERDEETGGDGAEHADDDMEVWYGALKSIAHLPKVRSPVNFPGDKTEARSRAKGKDRVPWYRQFDGVNIAPNNMLVTVVEIQHDEQEKEMPPQSLSCSSCSTIPPLVSTTHLPTVPITDRSTPQRAPRAPRLSRSILCESFDSNLTVTTASPATSACTSTVYLTTVQTPSPTGSDSTPHSTDCAPATKRILIRPDLNRNLGYPSPVPSPSPGPDPDPNPVPRAPKTVCWCIPAAKLENRETGERSKIATIESQGCTKLWVQWMHLEREALMYQQGLTVDLVTSRENQGRRYMKQAYKQHVRNFESLARTLHIMRLDADTQRGDQVGQEFDHRNAIKTEEAHAWAQIARGQLPSPRTFLAAEFRLTCAEVEARDCLERQERREYEEQRAREAQLRLVMVASAAAAAVAAQAAEFHRLERHMDWQAHVQWQALKALSALESQELDHRMSAERWEEVERDTVIYLCEEDRPLR
mmetsp:Transcript_20341/g.36335  ORF Transcript_20341/g.36335 Transcript_20341/m.36335 type:complete len:604 (-) Transcript_20341:132-1943(-)